MLDSQTTNELYSEIVYEILNAAGCDITTKEGRDSLLFYLQEAFRIDDEKHVLLLEKCKERTPPSIFLNIEVIEAMNLNPTDPNGLSDPFCTLYLTSANSQRQTTTVKPETLHPVWEECFTLPVKNPVKDVLCLEIWDFDQEETTREKMKRIKEVKGMRGIKIFMKEVASSNRHDLVGRSLLPLKNIPASGQTLWCTLEKNGKMKKQGEVKIHMSFGFEKNVKAAIKEHRNLLNVMLLHELEKLKENSVKWNGKFAMPAEKILAQRLVQCGLPPLSVTLARWIEFINVHTLHPLNYSIFLPLLNDLTKENLMSQEEEILFWEAAKKLLYTCMMSIRKLQIQIMDSGYSDQIPAILSIVSQIATLQFPNGIDLFPFTIYDWLSLKDGLSCDIHTTMIETVHQGAKDWFNNLLEKNKMTESLEKEEKLNKLVTITDLATTCLRKAVNNHDKFFQEYFHFPYAKELYTLYEKEIADLAETIVTSASKYMKPVKFIDDMEEGSCDSVTLSIGAALFNLYLSLQQLSALGKNLHPENKETLQLSNFHHWFYPAALQWLYISSYKSLHGIKKAIHLDQLKCVDDVTEYSSSAIDTLHLFEKIKIFWKQLAWPDHEASFTFATNIINDMCECSVFYADKISEKVERLCESKDLHEKRFEITKEWCIAVKNIGFVQQSIKTTVIEFGLEELVSSLANSGNISTAEICRQTVQTMIDSGVSTINNKVYDMLERAARKMMPTISRLLTEVDIETSNVDHLMKYLDDALCLLNYYLSPESFKFILGIIWKNVANIICNYMEISIKANKEPSYYKKQHAIITIIMDFFKQGDEEIFNTNSVILRKFEQILILNGMESWQLTHQYYLEQREKQKAMENARYGLLTVRMQFAENILRIEILNARNLHPLDKKSSCNPYVKISLLPEEKFSDTAKFVTKVHKKVLFPLFEETFVIELTTEQKNIKDGLVMFTVRDKCLIGTDKFLAEGFVSFADITKTDLTVRFESMEQMHLKLNRPSNMDSKAFSALKDRDDKLAKDFVKRRKHMFPVSEHQIN